MIEAKFSALSPSALLPSFLSIQLSNEHFGSYVGSSAGGNVYGYATLLKMFLLVREPVSDEIYASIL